MQLEVSFSQFSQTNCYATIIPSSIVVYQKRLHTHLLRFVGHPLATAQTGKRFKSTSHTPGRM